jgi:hypothetical protein
MACCWLAALPVVPAATYFVNDGNTNGDVYCTAVGVDALGRGTNASVPMLTLSNLLANVDLEPNDTVYIDTGFYPGFLATVASNDAGTAAGFVTFQGSTNYQAGGTVLSNSGVSALLTISSAVSGPSDGARSVRVQDMTFIGGQRGLLAVASPFSEFRRLIFRDQTVQGFQFGNVGNWPAPNTKVANCIVINGASGALLIGSTNVQIESSVFWAASRGVDTTLNPGQFSYLSNSVIRVAGAGIGSVYAISDNVVGDYNVFYPLSNAFISINLPHLHDLQASRTTDVRSTVADPLFANVTSNDFHARSAFGRFQSNGSVVTDGVTSVLVDFGPPDFAFANETAPNGSRINAGAYGNTAEASRSPTNPALRALTLNDSGGITGSVTLAWAAVNFTNGSLVHVDFSSNGGSTWTGIATNLPATNQQVVWNTTLFNSSAQSLWRIVSQSDTSVLDQVDQFFSVKNSNLVFYVNDGSTNSDVYCTATGHTANTGLSAASPLDSVQEILNRYDVGAGDTIYVDTGTYVLTNTLTFSTFDAGSTSQYLSVIGSTNFAAGGSVLRRNSSLSDVVEIYGANGIRLANLTLTAGRRGVFINLSTHTEIRGVTIWSNSLAGLQLGASGSGNGAANDVVIQNCLVANNGTGVAAVEGLSSSAINIRNCTFWMDRGVRLSGGNATVSNSIIRASGSGASCMEGPIASADYNVFIYQSGALVSPGYANLSEYQKGLNRDYHSATFDPLFVNTTGSVFQVRSEAGRWTPTGFTNDVVTSESIDFGDPAAPVVDETAPNGSRVNAGSNGNTERASRSRTNAWLTALSYRDGGTLNAGTDSIFWNAGNISSSATVRIELSSDGGTTWQVVQTNLSVYSGTYVWSNTNYPSTRFARWRVVLESDTNTLGAITTTNFTLRNGPFVYYVNDASTAGDMYCTAPGNDSNLGTAPGSPMATVSNLLVVHDLDAGDILYVDTGNYLADIATTITANDNGGTQGMMSIRGSTNVCAGGTFFGQASVGGFSADAIRFASGCDRIELRDLTIQGRLNGIATLGTVSNLLLQNLVIVSNRASGINIGASTGVVIRRSVAMRNSQSGLTLAADSHVTCENVVFWRNADSGINAGFGRAVVSNSVIVASGVTAQVYRARVSPTFSATTTTCTMRATRCWPSWRAPAALWIIWAPGPC